MPGTGPDNPGEFAPYGYTLDEIMDKIAQDIRSRLKILVWEIGCRVTADYTQIDGTRVRLEGITYDDLQKRINIIDN
jgi:uncharacterized protein YajQ (UPF0234 family)